MIKIKTYNGLTLKEIKKLHPKIKFKYCRYQGFGDYGIMALNSDKEIFYCDDFALMNRHNKAKLHNYTGTVSNLDYTCEVFVNGESLGNTSKHRAKIYLRKLKEGIKLDNSYLSSTRNYLEFLENSSEKSKLKTEINKLAHSIIDGEGQHGHQVRNAIRKFAYSNGIEKAKEKFLSI